MKPKNPLLTREALWKSYVEDKRTPTDIAREAGIAPPGIYEYLQRYGIPIRDRPSVTEADLRRMYLDERKTILEVSAIVGLSPRQICYWMRKYGIKSRTLTDYPADVGREWLLQQHEKLGRSWLEIRTELGMPSNSFFNMLARLKIPIERRQRGQAERTIRMNYRTQQDKYTPAERKSILKRDSHRCQMPGCRSKADARLEVHHIVSLRNGGVTTIENAITLCHSHHAQITGTEDEYISLFQEIVKHNSQEATGAVSVELSNCSTTGRDNTEGSLVSENDTHNVSYQTP